jgi:hypothetical protein
MRNRLLVAAGVASVTAVAIAMSFASPPRGPALAITNTPLPPYPKLHVARVTVEPSEEFAVNLTGEFEYRSVYGFALDVAYPPGLLDLIDCQTPPAFDCAEEMAGTVHIKGATEEAMTGQVDIGRIIWRASDYNCETFLPAEGVVFDEFGRNIIRSVDSGRVEIGHAPYVAAGDVTCDGLDAIDATLVLQIAAFLIGVGDVPYWPNADMNADGEYDSVDALLILQKVAGLL